MLRATGAGMRSVEHVKRYTSISTGVDQGRIGGVNTIGLLTRVLSGDDTAAIPPGQPGQEPAAPRAGGPGPGAIGATTFRAPFTPVAFAALAGRFRGDLFDAARTTSTHPWHEAHGALFEDVGQWKRPWYYPRPAEDLDAAVARECRAAREGVAFMDATTLGKIEIRGGDAGEFLDRIYTNAYQEAPVGKARYGVMCKPDGMVFDDGVILRLAEDRYFATTTTGGAARVLEWLEEWSQTEWPELDVVCTSVTEQWSTIAVVGPRSRDVIARLAPDLDVSEKASGSWSSARRCWPPGSLRGSAGSPSRASSPSRSTCRPGTASGCGRTSPRPARTSTSRPTAPRRCTCCAQRRPTRSSGRTPTAP